MWNDSGGQAYCGKRDSSITLHHNWKVKGKKRIFTWDGESNGDRKGSKTKTDEVTHTLMSTAIEDEKKCHMEKSGW